ncbi:MAG: carotenoid biosynthesis protein [Flavobacteriales bacterium]|nr:MAG: carotenoid biosynthesis protein [Flavobacteriales bacterium]
MTRIKLIKNKDALLQAILVVIYLVGIVGFSQAKFRDTLLPASGIVLYLSTLAIALASKNKIKFLVFMAIAFIIGFGAEVIGVNTAYLFGNYVYGINLGPKLLNVSIVIGLLWGVLALGAASIIDQMAIFNRWKVFFGAVIMLGVDLIMEPVAIANEFWSWDGENVPLYNYVCWFLIAILLQLILRKFKLNEKNKVYNTLLILMIVFFGFLNLY